FRDRGAPVHHETSPLADPALFPLLVERGYHPVEFTSVMYRPIARDVELAPSNSAMVVRRVEGDNVDRWARTAADGWRSEGANLGEFILEISRLQRVMDDAYQFLAELDGEPVAAGSLSIHDGIGLLAGASTIPSGR